MIAKNTVGNNLKRTTLIQQEFALKAKQILEKDNDIIGLAVGDSWLSSEIDEFSDLDLIVVTNEKYLTIKTKC